MTPERAALVAHRLTAAREALREADLLIAGPALRGAVNRLYYAALYAARALLAIREVDSARHSGVIALFQQHFVQTDIVAADVFRAFPQSFEKRLKSDYGDFTNIAPHEVETLRVSVRTFVDECERVSALESRRGT